MYERDLEAKILIVLGKHDALFSSAAPRRLAWDIKKLGIDTVERLALTMSPSQLGRMGLLGVRRLAQLRRDRGVEALKRLLKDLRGALQGGR